MTRTLCLVCCWLLSGPLFASFEIKDPAAESMASLEAAEAMGEDAGLPGSDRICGDFSKDRSKQNDAYYSDLTWLISSIGGSGAVDAASFDADAMARWITDYCEQYPEHDLNRAVRVAHNAGQSLGIGQQERRPFVRGEPAGECNGEGVLVQLVGRVIIGFAARPRLHKQVAPQPVDEPGPLLLPCRPDPIGGRRAHPRPFDRPAPTDPVRVHVLGVEPAHDGPDPRGQVDSVGDVAHAALVMPAVLRCSLE